MHHASFDRLMRRVIGLERNAGRAGQHVLYCTLVLAVYNDSKKFPGFRMKQIIKTKTTNHRTTTVGLLGVTRRVPPSGYLIVESAEPFIILIQL
jgi:hypothetical protein